MAALCLNLLAYATAVFVAVRHEFPEELEAEEQRLEHDSSLTPEARVEAQLREILVVLVLGFPLVVALAGVGGYVLARRALLPIDQLGAEARRITADRLDERLSVPNQHDEIGRLAAVINATLARLDRKSTRLNSSHLGISYAV